MAGTVADALAEVSWEKREPAVEDHPPRQMLRALRRLALKGAAATEEDCYDLYDCVALGTGRLPSLTTAALPFVVDLACDPHMGARDTLAELLVSLAAVAAGARPGAVDAGWHEEWRRQHPRIRALLADPVPQVRREALPLADGVGVLLERWHAETDPAVRLPALLALGSAAAGSGEAADVDRVRAVVTGVLRTGGPVLRVAAVHALAAFDLPESVRALDVLVRDLSDPAVRPRFEETWYVPGFASAFDREDIVAASAELFEDDPRTALSFAVRLVGAARRTGDALLCRAALDAGWRLLVVRPSAAAALLPLAGELLADPDAGVRYRAAHLLAVLGRPAAPYADALAALLDDPGGDEYFEGTVGDHARWALTRIGDPRALPSLVERLYEPYRDGCCRAYGAGDPRLPEVEDVLAPLGAHAEALLPAVRRLLREDGVGGSLTCSFLGVLKEWGRAAAPALPEAVTLLDDTRYSVGAVNALVAMGPAAAPAKAAVRASVVVDWPGNHQHVAWAVWRLGGDRDTALRLIGEAVQAQEEPLYGPVDLLGEFGPAAARHADRVRFLMEHGGTWVRLRAAIALWSITGAPEPSASVLEEYVRADHVLADTAQGGLYGSFHDALRTLARIGRVTPAVRATLRTVRAADRRLSPYRDYRAFLQDEEIRAAIDRVLALP
ncbi:hypothetical protein JCM4814A_90430 [Streptomyces phaeofaciens JCM 4814]|uniref:HEAT repeat domain-containing protein n=1 Tax=Streptomyces phaeofaciens TaxID=68254 RepID=A0A918LUK2_9ACTN|nr:hypothetical protein GCM10010226_31100 [Streptomyces phaeofaciens]